MTKSVHDHTAPEFDVDRALQDVAPQDIDRFRAQRLRLLAHEELEEAVSSRRRAVRAFEPVMVAAACILYIAWAFFRTYQAMKS